MTDETSGESPFSVDALLDGDDVRDDAIGELLAALKGVPVPAELEGESAAVAAFAAAIPVTTAVTATSSGIRRLTTRTGALAAVGALAFTGVAAAATGVPVPVVEELFNNDDAPTLVEEIVEEDLRPSDADGGLTTSGSTNGEGGSPESSADLDESEDGSSDKNADDAVDANHRDVVSDAAHSDCGKPAKPGDGTEDEQESENEAGVGGEDAALAEDECDARNHGEHVSDAAKDNRGQANNNGQGNNPGGGADDDAAGSDEGASNEAGKPNGASSSNGNSGGNGNGNGNAGGNGNGNGADD